MREADIRRKKAFDTYLEMVREDCRRLFGEPEALKPATCPACDSCCSTLQFTKMGFEYALCDKCETLFARTRPSFLSLKGFYLESPSTNFWIEEFFQTSG